MKFHVAILGLALGALPIASFASPIKYTVSGQLDGWVGGVPTATSMTLWAIGDSADIHKNPGLSTHNDLLVHIKIGSNVGMVNGLNSFFVAFDGTAGFSNSGGDFLDFYDPGLINYSYGSDFVSTSPLVFYMWSFQSSLGDVDFRSFTPERLEIDVDAVPEPASMAALAMGAVAFMRRRKTSA